MLIGYMRVSQMRQVQASWVTSDHPGTSALVEYARKVGQQDHGRTDARYAQ